MTAQVITVTSGKGGVGKTTAVANLATALAADGKRVVCIDGDIGLRNLDVIMGLENRIVYDIVDVIEGRCKLKQAMIRDKHYPSMYLIPPRRLVTRTLFRRLTWCASATTFGLILISSSLIPLRVLSAVSETPSPPLTAF